MSQIPPDPAFSLALQHHQAGRLQEAEQLYRQILTQQPTHAAALHLLGVLSRQKGQLSLAVDLIRQAISLKPDFPEAYYNLANALKSQGRFDEALAAYRQALAQNPTFVEAYGNLANTLRETGNLDEAVVAYRRTLALRPDLPAVWCNLGNALADNHELHAALAAYRQAIALNPSMAEAHANLASALKELGQFEQAIAAYHAAIAFKPDYAEAYSNLGNTLKEIGQLDDALAAHRKALELKPDFAMAHSNLILVLNYHPGCGAQEMAAELRRWNRQHAAKFQSSIRPHLNDSNPDRRLKIGYVSADFWGHASAFFLVPLLEHHDPAQVEIYCYARVLRPDETTRRMQQHIARWRSTVGLTDQQVAEQIRDDRIDILVDLKLHTGFNALQVFAQKPAPVQATWLGYPGSTGLETIDYRLSDPYLDPPGTDESVYSEQTIRLPDTFWCYDPLDGRDASVNALPAKATGRITFGCLNTFCKIDVQVLSLWAEILRAQPASRLLLLAHEGLPRRHTLGQFEKLSIPPERIEFVSPRPRPRYLELYHDIDLALDTISCNGHTTTLDSLWMGVPVVTLAGRTAMTRAGLCQLMNLKLPELVAATPQEYVRIALELSRDLPRLAELRATLRKRLEQSPLMDAPRFARAMEAAYRQMWGRWCAK